MRRTVFGFLTLSSLFLAGCSQSVATSDPNSSAPKAAKLLNVSYDPTRELWKELNGRFAEQYQSDAGVKVEIDQSHGGSSSQARQVIDGLEADVVTLALPTDTDAIRKAGLIKEGWQDRLPNHSLAYTSTIVFVVRQGNPKQIKDWPDLVRDGVEIITPSPKTSGNGKMSFLAAWGSVIVRGGSPADAKDFVAKLYQRVPVLDSGARASTATFAQKGLGDVHLTWENEAVKEVEEAKGGLELVRPPVSILAEPRVAVVDAVVDQKGTRAAAEAYLKFLYTDAGQEIIARHFYRPINAAILARYADTLPAIETYPITRIATDWAEAEQKFFSSGGVYDTLPVAKK